MNNRHLPAGQGMQGAGGPGPDMGPGNSGPRGPRRAYNPQNYTPQHQPVHMYNYGMGGHPAAHYHQQQGYYSQHMNNPYAQPAMGMHQQFMSYQQQQQHHQPHHHQPQPYPAAARSPQTHPITQQYAPIVTSGMGQPPYVRQTQQSPAIPAAYQPPPPPPAAVIANHTSHTPTSTNSAQAVAPPPPASAFTIASTAAPSFAPAPAAAAPATASTATVISTPGPPAQRESPAPAQKDTQPTAGAPKPSTPVEVADYPASEPEQSPASPASPAEEQAGHDRIPFQPPLPWYSHPEEPWIKRTTKTKRKKVRTNKEASVQLPPQVQPTEAAETKPDPEPRQPAVKEADVDAPKTDAAQPAARPDTPSNIEHAPSTSPTSPSSAQASTTPTATPTATATAAAAAVSATVSVATIKPVAPRTAVPAIPVVPAVPKKQPAPEKTAPRHNEKAAPAAQHAGADPATTKDQSAAAPAVTGKFKTWSGLFAPNAPAMTPATSNGGGGGGGAAAAGPITSQTQGGDASGRGASGAALGKAGPASVIEALRSFKVSGSEKISFLEPRGLINTGNMCYMNSVLQVLLFSVPFYDFLHQVYKKAAHSFKSETPLIDAMVMFMKEFNLIDSASSPAGLHRLLKPEHLEKFGEPFTPEFVYDVIKKLPRFSSMRRGHQQDAEEFLGFLLESLHDECIHAMRATPSDGSASTTSASSPISTHEASDANGWMEVGYRQKPTVTRSSGHPQMQSPISKIFGGQLRSELRVPGLKDSVTLEPYQPLQLDITASNVRNIVDALKGLTNPETLQGDFKSPRGKGVTATKQIFIESLPPVLILHLKRFQFDAEGNGTVKVWKKIGYPLELEIPKEVFPRGKRNTMASEGVGAPRYKLSAVVYHHGKNASGGHYTVDVRRQDGTEWIRLDDTVIRRIRSEDVAEGGAEEDTKSPAWGEGRKDGIVGGSGNRFSGIDHEESGDDDGWKHVAPAANGKKWSSVVNGGSTPAANLPAKKPAKDNNVKDNKVAYLLFYQRI